jgi:hypothetical protein
MDENYSLSIKQTTKRRFTTTALIDMVQFDYPPDMSRLLIHLEEND